MNSFLASPTSKVGAPGTPALQSSRGFRVGGLDYGSAPQIDARGIGASMRQGSWGEALQKVGGTLSAIAQAEFDAINTRRIAEAEISMAAARSDIAAEVAASANDPDSWEGIATKRVSEIQKTLLTKDLSPNARAEIELRALKWGTSVTGEMKVAKARRQFDLTGQTLQVAHSQAIEAKDYDSANEAVEAMAPYVGPAGAENARSQITIAKRGDVDAVAETLIKNGGSGAVPDVVKLYKESDAFDDQTRESRLAGLEYSAQVEDMKVLAVNDPFQAPGLARARNLRGPDLIAVERLAESSIQEGRASAMKGYEQSIKMGNLPSREELESNQFLTPFDRGTIAAFATEGPKNDPVSFASLFSDAANFKGDEGSPEYAVLAQRASLALDGELQSRVLSKLGESVKMKNPDELTRSMSEVYSLAKDDLAAGRFGELHSPLSDNRAELPAKIRAEVNIIKSELMTEDEKARIAKEPSRADYLESKARDAWFSRNNPKPADGESFSTHVVEDSAKATLAQRRYGDALANLEKWKRDNPKATPQQLRAQYDKSLVIQRAVTGVPSVPGGFNNPLLPSLDKSDDNLKKTRAILNSN